jgi:uncharacterized protein with PIN domain
MLYWDTSALFAFLITEKHSPKLRSLVQQQATSTAYTAIITPLEFESAIQRRLSERTLNLREADRARLFGVDFRNRHTWFRSIRTRSIPRFISKKFMD